MKSSNTNQQAIELNLSCFGQTYPNRPGTGYWHESSEPGYIFTTLCVPSIACPLDSADAYFARSFGISVQRSQTGI